MSNIQKNKNTNNNNDIYDYIFAEINNIDQKVLATIINRDKLINIALLIAQGTHPEIAFRTENAIYTYKCLASFANTFTHLADDSCTELIILRLCERIWYKSIAKITANIYNIAIGNDARHAILASKLLLDYQDNFQERIEKYKLLHNYKGRKEL
jgi:hypothetical protein